MAIILTICIVCAVLSTWLLAHLIHIFLLLDALSSLVLLSLIQTDVAEEDGANQVDV